MNSADPYASTPLTAAFATWQRTGVVAFEEVALASLDYAVLRAIERAVARSLLSSH